MTKLNSRKDYGCQGFGLVEVLIAAGLLSMLIAGIMSMFKYSFQNQRVLSSQLDRDELRMHLLRLTRCTDTLPGGVCAPGSLVAVRNGATVVVNNSNPVTRFGSFAVRAECTPAGNGFVLKGVHLAATGTISSTAAADFYPEPGRTDVVTWADNRALLSPPGVTMCTTDTMENRVAALETQVALLDGRLTALEGRVGALEGRVTAVETLFPRVAAIEAKLAAMTANTCTNPRRGIGSFAADGTQQCAPAPGDYNGDGYTDLFVGGSGVGGNGHVKILSGASARSGGYAEIGSFLAFPGFGGGIHGGLMDVNGDGFADAIVGAEQNAHVKIFSGPGGGESFSHHAFPGFTGGVTVGP